jgi:hypothetical protein
MFDVHEQLAMFRDSQSSAGALLGYLRKPGRETAEIPDLFYLISVPSRGANEIRCLRQLLETLRSHFFHSVTIALRVAL